MVKASVLSFLKLNRWSIRASSNLAHSKINDFFLFVTIPVASARIGWVECDAVGWRGRITPVEHSRLGLRATQIKHRGLYSTLFAKTIRGCPTGLAPKMRGITGEKSTSDAGKGIAKVG